MHISSAARRLQYVRGAATNARLHPAKIELANIEALAHGRLQNVVSHVVNLRLALEVP